MMSGSAHNQRRIRVTHVVGQLAVGGMEKLLTEIARHADPARYDLNFVSLGGRDTLADEIEACGWPVTALGKRPGVSLGLVFRIARLISRNRADIVHTHNNPALFYAGPAARLVGVGGVVHTRHGQSYRAGRRQRFGFRVASRFADRIVCVSDDSRRLSLSDGAVPRRVCRVWNGIDLNRFAFRGPSVGGPVVMVARLSPEKNADCLLKAAQIITNQHPSFRLEIAGNGACLPDLRRRAEELALKDVVTFLGEVHDVPSVLARASAFVLPSLSEGVSLTLLEAMARGLPVVATAVGGTPEVVTDGVTGFLVPSNSPADMANALLRLLEDAGLCHRMGRAGRARVEADFSITGMLDQYGQLYHEVLGTRATRGPVQPKLHTAV